MNEDSSPGLSEPERKNRHTTRPMILLVLALCAGLLFTGFVALGTWQVKRLFWKRDLIERVDQRVHAPAGPLSPREHWNDISALTDEYRHVQVRGVFLHQFTTRVHASTILGRGFWLLTPLQTADGSVIWINRGFIAYSAAPAGLAAATPGAVDVTGLLRMNEPDGTVLNRNQPDRQQWYSRDIAAMTAKYQLNNVAPFFIDAAASEISDACRGGICSNQPVGGLTVISFNNNHLVYSITWYILALMVAVACYILGRTEFRLRHLNNRPRIDNEPHD